MSAAVRTFRGLVLIALIAAIAGCGGTGRSYRAGAPEPLEPEREADGVHHRVVRGQTLWRIARVYGVSIQAVMEANGIDDPTRIASGQRLFIPGADRVREVPPAPAPLPGEGSPDPEADTAPEPIPDPGAGAGDSGWLWPVSGPVTSGFGASRSHGRRRHMGIDVAVPRGTEVRAARSGTVRRTGRRSGYGLTVVIRHDEGFTTLYAHLSGIAVSPGERVGAGQPIGRTGRTGNANGAHLHFEIRHHGRHVDPRLFLP
jgi:murein DD-endopeptidase MepM/ murein hydrolase activator NlpD